MFGVKPRLSCLLQVWMVVQRKWMYLEGIFIGGDIRSQLPEEAKRFDLLDKTFKKVRCIERTSRRATLVCGRQCFSDSRCPFQIMNDTSKIPNVKQACHAPNRLMDLERLSVGLEKCQKSLNDYLDSKRNAFARFFFISDDELLSILGSSDPECVQEHMIKVYADLHHKRSACFNLRFATGHALQKIRI